MGKGVTLSDWLLVIAIVGVGGAVVGAFTGFYGDRVGLTGTVRSAIIAGYAGLAGVFARSLIMRRVKARSAPPRVQA